MVVKVGVVVVVVVIVVIVVVGAGSNKVLQSRWYEKGKKAREEHERFL